MDWGVESQPPFARKNQNGSKSMKFYGPVGFSVTEQQEDDPDVWKEKITEKKYSGDILPQYTRRNESGEHINDGPRLNMQISLLCMDPWFHDHFTQIRYLVYNGVKWEVETIDPTKYPSIVVTLGGIYHGYEPEDEETGTGSDSEEDSGD